MFDGYECLDGLLCICVCVCVGVYVSPVWSYGWAKHRDAKKADMNFYDIIKK